MRIGIDIDGVVLDFERQMRFYAEYYDVLCSHHGKVNSSFSYLDSYDWSFEEAKHFKETYLIKGTRVCSLVPGCKEILSLLHEEGIQIFFITARGSVNPKTKEEVLKALRKYSVIYDEIFFEVTDKVCKCKELQIDLMIDDHPAICQKLQENKIFTMYLKDNEQKLRKSRYLVTVQNWGEILRYFIDHKIISKKEDMD